ncbi:MAG TPA: hypothetical protein VKA46_08810 [Gemmataceae bacterium]|nr:hypothetical protein [Gemmataceae bacterium]
MKLGTMKNGRFFRNVGYLHSGSQPKFYLGRDKIEAMVRAGKIEQLWRFVVADHERAYSHWTAEERADDSGPFWFGFPLDAARAVAEGVPVGEVPGGWLERLAEVGIATTSPTALATGKIETFGQAVKDYIAAVNESHPTLWGTGKVRLIEFVAERVPDFTLGDLDLAKIDSILRLMANRPVSNKTGEPISQAWARNAVKEFRCFLRWLHLNKHYHWRRPDDYEVRPVKVARSQKERARITSLAVETFSVEELTTLWRYALPWERLMMALGLNCGFGMAEMATLRPEEVFFGQPHPFAGRLGLPEEPADWIRRLRGKSDVYGEWRLWDITAHALRWVMALRPHPTPPAGNDDKNGRQPAPTRL